MVNDTDNDANGDFKELQDALLSTESVEQFLHEMTRLAAGLVRGGLSCGMTVRSGGRPMTVACSDPVAAQVDEVQYKLDDGPCLHAMRDGHTVRIEDTTRMKDTGVKARWPEFEARAAAHGIRSCLALPLTADGRSIGAINLYARTASAFGAAEARRAESFAENASGALTLALRLSSHVLLIDQLRSSLSSRTVIDQALGIIMARQHCGQSRAFAILRAASQNSNVKLREIASAIVTSVTGEPVEPPPPFEDALRVRRSRPVGVSLRGGTFLLTWPGAPTHLCVGARQAGGDAGKHLHQAVDTGKGEDPVHGRHADHEAQCARTGHRLPEGAY
jgi:hypothetical protein